MVPFFFLAGSVGVYLYSFTTLITYDRSNGQTPEFQMAMGLLLTVSIPKLAVILILFGEDMYRGVFKLISAIASGETKPLVGRRKFYFSK